MLLAIINCLIEEHVGYLQQTVVILLCQETVPLRHIKTHFRVLRYSSDVAQGLFKLAGRGQCVKEMEGGILLSHACVSLPTALKRNADALI